MEFLYNVATAPFVRKITMGAFLLQKDSRHPEKIVYGNKCKIETKKEDTQYL